jgi:hypothetical protein
MHAHILALSSSGCTFLRIDLSYKSRVLIPRPRIDLGFRFISVKTLLCMCPDSLYLLVYKGEGRSISFIHSVFHSRKQWVNGTV